jgi:A/G-specific adenine glycosylase
MDDASFRRTVNAYARRHGRHDLPWRTTTDPYRILVSEVMLQQTQVPRVAGKYREFLTVFPSFRALAAAPASAALKVWQGLGYNRRALMLHRCAKTVVGRHGGRLPGDYDALRGLPGVGPYTAGAVLAFAFDEPHPVIETNIRRAYIHHWFPRRRKVDDAEIFPLVERHVRQVRSPRHWYGALMDYGTHLSAVMPNPNRRSRHHVRQAAFEGSLRQLRGAILRHLTECSPIRRATLAAAVGDARLDRALASLEREGFLCIDGPTVRLAP